MKQMRINNICYIYVDPSNAFVLLSSLCRVVRRGG